MTFEEVKQRYNWTGTVMYNKSFSIDGYYQAVVEVYRQVWWQVDGQVRDEIYNEVQGKYKDGI